MVGKRSHVDKPELGRQWFLCGMEFLDISLPQKAFELGDSLSHFKDPFIKVYHTCEVKESLFCRRVAASHEMNWVSTIWIIARIAMAFLLTHLGPGNRNGGLVIDRGD